MPLSARLITRNLPTPDISFEFFPPKDEKAALQLWDSIQQLAPLSPSFISVTYGAGGSTRNLTHQTVCRIQQETHIPAAAHLTCVGASREEIAAIAQHYWQAGIRHLVALRGDAPKAADGSSTPYTPHPHGYHYADELVAGLKAVADFDISVAAYPETHPEAPSAAFDLDHLKRKQDAGASRAITQYFFDTDRFLRFRDKAVAHGIHMPLIPGILPVTNVAVMQRFSAACGVHVPDWLAEYFTGLDSAPGKRQLVAAMIAIEQCRLLQTEGVEHFHFYTLNRSELTQAICHMLGKRPPSHQEQAA